MFYEESFLLFIKKNLILLSLLGFIRIQGIEQPVRIETETGAHIKPDEQSNNSVMVKTTNEITAQQVGKFAKEAARQMIEDAAICGAFYCVYRGTLEIIKKIASGG